MENLEPDNHSVSSRGRSEKNSARSRPNSPRNSKSVEVADVGAGAAAKLTSCDILLSQLQSLIGEIKEAGKKVKLYQVENGIMVGLDDSAICPRHKILHDGMTCPHC